MAGADYANCDNCGKGKVFYDANVDWESFQERIGAIRILCTDCTKKGFKLLIQKKGKNQSFNNIHNYGIHSWTQEWRNKVNQEQQEGGEG